MTDNTKRSVDEFGTKYSDYPKQCPKCKRFGLIGANLLRRLLPKDSPDIEKWHCYECNQLFN